MNGDIIYIKYNNKRAEDHWWWFESTIKNKLSSFSEDFYIYQITKQVKNFNFFEEYKHIIKIKKIKMLQLAKCTWPPNTGQRFINFHRIIWSLKLFSTLNGDQNGSCKSTNVYAQAQ